MKSSNPTRQIWISAFTALCGTSGRNLIIILKPQLLQELRLTAARQYDETTATLKERINTARQAAYDLGFNPDEAPKVKELRATLEELSLKESLEESVLSDLVEFLRRYYKDGDFLSLPRYRKNSYAIEYNGEEVKLHWANADQY